MGVAPRGGPIEVELLPMVLPTLLNSWVIAVFAAYSAILVAIALVRSRHMEAMSDYVLGNRQMSAVTSALSAGSSTTSGWTMLVFPALAFTYGANILWLVGFLALGAWFGWMVVAKRLRRYTILTDDSLTLPEFFEKRFDDRTGLLRTLAGILTIFFVIFYINSGLVAGAKLLNSVFDLPVASGVFITLVAVASYTFIGGFKAVSHTDVFQSMLMLLGFIIMPVTVILVASNPFEGTGGEASGFLNPFTDSQGATVTVVFLLGNLGWGLGVFGSHRVLNRFMAVESESRVNRSRDISFLWIVAIFSLGFLLGLVARPALDAAGLGVEDAELVYFVVADHFFPAIITGLLLTAVIAAVMSTADSQLLLSAAIATDDLPFVRNFAYSIDTAKRVWLGRGLLLVIGIASAIMALTFPDSILNLVAYAWGGMGATFGPVVILALYWRRFNGWGAAVGMISGALVATLWQFVLSGGPQGVFDVMPATPGFVIATPLAVAATLLTSRPSDEIASVFDDVAAGKNPAYA